MPDLRLRFTPYQPFPKQVAFLSMNAPEVVIGGGWAGGKTTALLMGAAQYLDVPGYHALIGRATVTDLRLPAGLVDVGDRWFGPHVVERRDDGRSVVWVFPSGATLTAGVIDGDTRTGSYRYVAFDEAQEFPHGEYYDTFCRYQAEVLPTLPTPDEAADDGTTLADVPPRMRASYTLHEPPADPVPERLQWVIDRFIDRAARHAPVVPMTYHDNPAVDDEAMAERLTAAGLPVV